MKSHFYMGMDQLASEEDAENSNNVKQDVKKRKGRGSTTLPSVIKDMTAGVRKTIQYNQKGQPIGDNATKYVSYLGVLGRTMVPLTYDTWHKVPKELKEQLWSCVEFAYIVDPKSKKKVISAIGEHWRTFKSTLTKEILKNKSNLDLLSKPPDKYGFIEQSDWDSFVKVRLSSKFKRLSDKQKERRGNYIYNHRLSRKGYARLEEEMKCASGLTEDIDRSILWKKARQSKKGEYDSELIMQQVEKIDELLKQTKDGSLATQGSNDILTMALGKPEHSGRVRGVGHFVTPSVYFNIPRRTNHEICDGKYRALEAKLEQLQAQLNAICQHPPQTSQSEYVSSNILKSDNKGCAQLFPKNDNGGLQLDPKSRGNRVATKDGMPPSNPCKLAVGSIENIVAHGKIYERVGPDETIHTVPLGESNVRVAIDVVVVHNAPLPIPVSGEMTYVGDAIGCHVAWPKNLVIIGDEVHISKFFEVKKFGNRISSVVPEAGGTFEVAPPEAQVELFESLTDGCREAVNDGSLVDDARLLLGMHYHGFGNWEKKRLDSRLGLTRNIAPVTLGEGETFLPRAPNLDSRATNLLQKELTFISGKSSKAKAARKAIKSEAENTFKIYNSRAKGAHWKAGSPKLNVRTNKETFQKCPRVEPRIKEVGEISESEHGRFQQFKEEKWMEWCSDVMEEEEQTLKRLERLQTASVDLPKEKVLSRFRKYLQLLGRKIDKIVQEHEESYEQSRMMTMRLWNYVSTFSNLSGERLYEIYSELEGEKAEVGVGPSDFNGSAAGLSDRDNDPNRCHSFFDTFRGKRRSHRKFSSRLSAEAFYRDQAQGHSEEQKRRRRADMDKVQPPSHQQATISNGKRLPEPSNSPGILGWGPPDIKRFLNERLNRARPGCFPPGQDHMPEVK